jgi:hypothetical protein
MPQNVVNFAPVSGLEYGETFGPRTPQIGNSLAHTSASLTERRRTYVSEQILIQSSAPIWQRDIPRMDRLETVGGAAFLPAPATATNRFSGVPKVVEATAGDTDFLSRELVSAAGLTLGVHSDRKCAPAKEHLPTREESGAIVPYIIWILHLPDLVDTEFHRLFAAVIITNWAADARVKLWRRRPSGHSHFANYGGTIQWRCAQKWTERPCL